MQTIQLLDVTLRDGGYCNNFNYGMLQSTQVITSMENANIDYIEIGYRNGSAKPIPHIGQNGLCENSFIKQVIKKKNSKKITVMLHAKNCTHRDIYDLHASNISLVRFCLGSTIDEHTTRLIELTKDLGLKISGNITRITEKNVHTIKEMALKLKSLNVDIIYLADSNGNLTPENTRKLFETLRTIYDGQLGFHAHNNLGLAFANTLAAIEAGASIIDGSLAGIGKGAGNLAIEKFISYLQVSHENNKYNLLPIITLLEQFKQAQIIKNDEESIKNLLLGAFNLSIDDAQTIEVFHSDLQKYYQTAEQLSMQKRIKQHLC